MSLPALQALRDRFPQAHIAVLARSSVADLYAREAFVNEVILHPSARGWKDLRGKWRLAKELRKQKFDCAILFQNAFEAAALVWLARIPNRIGYDRDARGMLLTQAIPVPLPDEIPRHERFYYLELLRRAGLIENIPQSDCIRLTGAAAACSAGMNRYREMGIVTPVVGISPGAAYGTAKRWLPERFAEAAILTARVSHATVALFGTTDERRLCEQIESVITLAGIPCQNFAGRTTLREFIDLCAASQVYLTNDSGGMHIASALGVPTVAVFGATDHIATGPTGPLARIVREPVECSPCLLRECPIDHRCMTRVSAERVAEAARELLK
jgi:heptosyltransferase-2